jgi:ArsR family transcriptional regulator
LCQCELLPLFDMSQAAVAKHLKVLVAAGVLGSERRGTWMYYHLRPEALKELITWLS